MTRRSKSGGGEGRATRVEKKRFGSLKVGRSTESGEPTYLHLTPKEVEIAKASLGIRRGKPSYVVSRGRETPATGSVYGYGILTQFLDNQGLVVIDDVANWFGMSKAQFASTVGVRAETLQRVQRATAEKTQNRVKEMLEIVGRIAAWAGGKDQAMAWYRAEPLPAFGGRTAEALVKEGKAAAVRSYLDHIALGGFA